jgi:hypothetical protein
MYIWFDPNYTTFFPGFEVHITYSSPSGSKAIFRREPRAGAGRELGSVYCSRCLGEDGARFPGSTNIIWHLLDILLHLIVIILRYPGDVVWPICHRNLAHAWTLDTT